MNQDIEQQARKEAEEYCERVHPYAVSFGLKETIITCHAEALISERSKPIATCEPIYGDYGGINGYSCSSCGAPIGPPEFSRYCGNCARKVLWPEGANYQTHPPKPSLMVGFSEEEVRLIADEVAEDCGVDDETEYGAYTWKCMLECAMKVHEAHAANTRAVSIDRLVEAVKEWIKASVDGSPIDDDEWKQDEWLKAEADLRERLMKINKQ